MTDSISLHDCSSEWSPKQVQRLRLWVMDEDECQLVMRVYTPKYFFERLEEHGSSLMVRAAKNLEGWYETVAPYVRREQERKEEEHKKRFPTPWEKDLEVSE